MYYQLKNYLKSLYSQQFNLILLLFIPSFSHAQTNEETFSLSNLSTAFDSVKMIAIIVLFIAIFLIVLSIIIRIFKRKSQQKDFNQQLLDAFKVPPTSRTPYSSSKIEHPSLRDANKDIVIPATTEESIPEMHMPTPIYEIPSDSAMDTSEFEAQRVALNSRKKIVSMIIMIVLGTTIGSIVLTAFTGNRLFSIGAALLLVLSASLLPYLPKRFKWTIAIIHALPTSIIYMMIATIFLNMKIGLVVGILSLLYNSYRFGTGKAPLPKTNPQ